MAYSPMTPLTEPVGSGRQYLNGDIIKISSPHAGPGFLDQSILDLQHDIMDPVEFFMESSNGKDTCLIRNITVHI